MCYQFSLLFRSFFNIIGNSSASEVSLRDIGIGVERQNRYTSDEQT